MKDIWLTKEMSTMFVDKFPISNCNFVKSLTLKMLSNILKERKRDMVVRERR